jgi:hypothetical protein
MAFDLDANAFTLKEKAVAYQYKVVKFELKGALVARLEEQGMEAELNQYGAKGWELHQIVTVLHGTGQTKLLVATLKKTVA